MNAQNKTLQRFPALKAKTLTRNSISIPADTQKKVNIIILVFEQQAQEKQLQRHAFEP